MIKTVKVNTMFDKLSDSDKRAVKLGSVCVVVILGYFWVVSPWFSDWAKCRQELARERSKLESISVDDKSSSIGAKQAGLFSVVPVFEMPVVEKEQMPLFRGKFNEQLKKTGVKVKSLQAVSAKKTKSKSGVKKAVLQFKGKCGMSQLLDLLADLNSNPYFLGVENVQIRCDPKQRNEMDMVMTVSTLVK